jgi:hypothetical protein
MRVREELRAAKEGRREEACGKRGAAVSKRRTYSKRRDWL